VIWSVLLRGGGGEPAAWRRAAALWVVLSVMFLHRTGAALATGGWQARAAAAHDARRDQGDEPADADDRAAHGWAARLAALAPAAVFAGVAGALLAGVAERQMALRAAWDLGLTRFAPALAAALDHPAAHAVLTPARLVVAPLFAAPAGGAGWGRAIAAALAVLALHYLWVLRTDAAVHELGTAAGARWRALRSERRVRAGVRDAPAGREAARPAEGVRRRPAPRLAPLGWPATALIWKNLVAASRAAALGRLLALFAVAAAGVLAVAARAPRVAELAGVVAGVWGAMLVIAGPTWVRVDLRHDLPHLPFLRAAPLAGRDVVAAEIAASTLALTAVQFAAFTLLGLATLGARDGYGFSGTERAAAALAGALALPGVNAALLTVHNGAALLFPAWVRPPGAPRGMEAMGQNLVLTALTLAAAVLVLAPAAVAAGAAWWATDRATGGAAGPWAWAPGALTGTLAALGVLAPVVLWLGRVFDRTDPPAADALGG
jgi:hypothetical protein